MNVFFGGDREGVGKRERDVGGHENNGAEERKSNSGDPCVRRERF